MHFCAAEIALSGDMRNIVVRNEFNPVSWPEIEVIRVLHGDESIVSVRPFVNVPQSPRGEWRRLAYNYGAEPLAERWGGRNPPTELEAPGAMMATDVVWYNPLTRRVEKSDGKVSVPHAIATFVPPSYAEMNGVATVGAVGDLEFLKAPKAAAPKESEYYTEDEDEPVYPPEGIAAQEVIAAPRPRAARK